MILFWFWIPWHWFCSTWAVKIAVILVCVERAHTADTSRPRITFLASSDPRQVNSRTNCYTATYGSSLFNVTRLTFTSIQLLGNVSICLVSTYVVCERLSVMHEPAGVVEILVQILREYPYSVVQNTPPNENCQRVQVQVQNTPPKWKLSESKSEFRIPPQNENCQRVQVWVQNTPPKTKIVRESKSEFRIPPQNDNCQRVQVWVQNTPPNENCQRVQVQNTPLPPKWKLSESPSPSSEYPPKWKLSESPSLSSEYPPPMKIVRESKSEFRIPPQKWKLSESPSPSSE